MSIVRKETPHYRVIGEHQATAVLCHGLMASSRFWDPLIDRMIESHRIMTWDMAGHGVTRHHGDSLPTIQNSAERLLRIMDAERFDRGVLVGHSLGCQVALEAVMMDASRFSSLVLISPVIGGLRDDCRYGLGLRFVNFLFERSPWGWGHQYPRLITRVARSSGLWRVARVVKAVHPRLTIDEALDLYAEDVAMGSPRAIAALIHSANDVDHYDRLCDIRVPTLVIAGARDPFVKVRFAEMITSSIRRATLRIVFGGTHALPIEFPQTVSSYIKEFTRRRDDGRDVRSPAEELHAALVSMFSADGLRRFCRFGRYGDEVIREIPERSSLDVVAESVIQSMRTRGLIDQEFFERLYRARPRRGGEIDRLAGRWLDVSVQRCER